MSRYSKMQAPPFWMWMFRIAGILCLVTLITPAFYLLKYSLFDQPAEVRLVKATPDPSLLLTKPAFANATALYIETALRGSIIANRITAVTKLGQLASNVTTQILRPVECLHIKLTLEEVAVHDPSSLVRSAAVVSLENVLSHDAIVKR